MPPQPEIEKLEKKLEKVSISDHRSQSRPKHHRHSKTRKPPESPEVKSGQTENSKPKQRGRSRGPKPKKAKNRDPDGPTPIPISNPGSQVVSPRFENCKFELINLIPLKDIFSWEKEYFYFRTFLRTLAITILVKKIKIFDVMASLSFS